MLGAAGGVTGQAFLLETRRARVLVDFGAFQGSRAVERLNVLPRGLAPGKLDAVVATHAHYDHVGRLPMLVRQGWRGPVHATRATAQLAELVLRDAARLHAQDLARENRRRARAGEPPLEPRFDETDVEILRPLFRRLEYDEPREVAPGVTVRLVDAGHILGSASVEASLEEAGERRVVVFSGDLGPRGAPILRDPTPFRRADVVLLESTYGDRDHRPLADTLAEAGDIVREVVARRGKILIPTFAIGRAQLLLWWFAAAFRARLVPPFPIYLDSPMAIQATRIHAENLELFDDEARELVRSGRLRRDLRTVRPCATARQSRALNDAPGPCAILAGSGMCTGGRILHHLKHNLWRPDCAVVIAGYQAEGTLGRQLVDGATSVSVFGERIAVRASVHTLGGFSAHAGQGELLAWLGALAPAKPRVVLVHGEDGARAALARRVQQRFRLPVEVPLIGEAIAL
jgi:metallo-beta-lactamase family protein